MRSFDDPVEEIKERVDLVEIISQDVALKRSGQQLRGLCPFHPDKKSPSFYVHPERKFWKCYGCQEGGDLFSYVMKRDSLTFREALELLAKKAGVTLERDPHAAKQQSEKERLLRANNVACDFFRSTLKQAAFAQDYLSRREIAASTVEKYRIGYAPDSWDALLEHLTVQRVDVADAVKAGLIIPRENSTGFYDRFRNRLMFPIVDTSERIVAFGGRTLGDDPAKYLNSPETPLFIKNRTVYGLNFARKMATTEDRVIVVEGYMDCIACQEAGFENTIATMGTALTEEHVNLVARFTKNAVLSFDADSAGMAAALRSSPIFERAGFSVRILSMPKGEDPDSLLRSGDRSKFAVLIEKALPVLDYRVKIALRRHDLTTDDGKAAGLRAAAEVLAESESAVERERLIRHLARYHPNFSTGTALAEDHLRSEVAQFRSRARQVASERTPADQRGQASGQVRSKLALLEHSERVLLGIIIVRGGDASKVFGLLPPKEFTEEPARALAEAVSKQFSSLGKIDQEKLFTECAGTPAGDLMTEMLVGLDASEMEHPVDEIVETIIHEKKRIRHRRFRALAQRFEEGVISRGSEEFEEFQRLTKELSGNDVSNPHARWGRK